MKTVKMSDLCMFFPPQGMKYILFRKGGAILLNIATKVIVDMREFRY
jgi:hypothetical protein